MPYLRNFTCISPDESGNNFIRIRVKRGISMRKSTPIFISLLLFVILFSAYYVKIQSELEAPENTLLKCINSVQANLTCAETYFWARLDRDKLQAFSSVRTLGDQLAESIGFRSKDADTGDLLIKEQDQKLRINGKLKNGREVSISLQQREDGKGYITINIQENLEDIRLYETRQNISSALKKLGIEASVNTCLRGVVKGKLEEDRLEALNSLVLKTAGAKKVDAIRDGDLSSISAYSPLMGTYLKVGGNRVNLNFAARYSPSEDETYLWLATPVITTEY